MLFCCLWRNAETSCHKHFVVVSRHQQTLPLTTSGNCCNLPRSGDTVSITPGCHSIESTRWSQILAQNRDFYLPHLHSTPSLGEFLSEYCHAVWYGKLEWLGYPAVKKNLKIFYSFWYNSRTWQIDRQTDGHTDTALWLMPRLHSIARQNSSKQCKQFPELFVATVALNQEVFFTTLQHLYVLPRVTFRTGIFRFAHETYHTHIFILAYGWRFGLVVTRWLRST